VPSGDKHGDVIECTTMSPEPAGFLEEWIEPTAQLQDCFLTVGCFLSVMDYRIDYRL